MFRRVLLTVFLFVLGSGFASSAALAKTRSKKSNAAASAAARKLIPKNTPSKTTAQSGGSIDRLEASVNSSIILLSDIRKFRDTMKLRQQLDPLFRDTSLAQEGPSAKDTEIVTFIIDERLIALAFPVADQEVEQEINSIQSNNHIDRATLKSALTEQGFKFEDYFELIRVSASKRNLIDRDIRTKVSISEDDVKNYFYNHTGKSSATPQAYHLKIIGVANANYKTPAAAGEVARRAHEALDSGEPFDEVAKRFSTDESATSGGDLGDMTEDQMSPQILAEVKKLRIGQTSPIFANNRGHYIIRLTDVKTNDSDRYEKAKEEIRTQLAAAEYQHQIQLWLDRQAQNAFIHRAGEPATAGLPAVSSG